MANGLTNNNRLKRELIIDDLVNIKGIDPVALIPLHGIGKDNIGCSCKLGLKCPSIGKHPRYTIKKTVFGLSYQKKLEMFLPSDDESLARTNIGIACGSNSFFDKNSNKSLIVIDIDNKSKDSSSPLLFGSEILKDIEKYSSTDKLNTFKYKTGSGTGLHLWYWYDNKGKTVTIKNSVKALYDDVDIRSDGGIVVIPGSLYYKKDSKSISEYSFIDPKDELNDILELPTFLYNALLLNQQSECKDTKQKAPKKLLGAKKQKMIRVTGTNNNVSMSLKSLREDVVNKSQYKIPLGARNLALFKLLSQDRRQGIASKQKVGDLYAKAITYRNLHCEDPESISNKELYTIARSAFKSNKPMKMVPNKNMTYKDLSYNYFIWVGNNRKLTYSDAAKQKMIKTDEDFFAELTSVNPEENKEFYYPLQHISNVRDFFLEDVNGLTSYFRYPLKHLAKKLSDMGFKRKRTAKGNIWCVYSKLLASNDVEEEIIKKKNKKMAQKVYTKSKLSYNNVNVKDDSHSLSVIGSIKEMSTTNSSNSVPATTTTATAVPQQIPASAPVTSQEQMEEKIKKLPVWAVQDKAPQIIVGVKIPDLVADPNAIPWFTPPGFRDEQVTKLGVFTRHDNEKKYIQYGMTRRSYIELTEKFYEFIDTLTDQEQTDFSNLSFIRDEQKTAAEYDKIEEGQVIGCMLQSDSNASYALEVVKRFEGEDTLACKIWNGEIANNRCSEYRFPKEEVKNDPERFSDLVFVTFQDVSYSLAMDHFEILYYKRNELDVQAEIDEIEAKTAGKIRSLRVFDKVNLYAPYGYENKFKEYNMIIRYRIQQGYPDHVDDSLLEQEYKTAYDQYVLDNQDKIEKQAQEEREAEEAKQREKEEKLQKIKDEISSYPKS